MLKIFDGDGERFSETQWKSLRYFAVYRCCIAALLFGSALLHPSAFSILTPQSGFFLL